jgi:hypothetical protein
LLPLVFLGSPASLPNALPAALRSGACWLDCALPSYLRASEPGDGSLVRLSLETRSDREDLQSRPPVAIRWVGYGVEEPVDDAIARGLTVETSADVILLLVEVQLPAVPQFRRPGVGHAFKASALAFAAGQLRNADERQLLQLEALQLEDVVADLQQVVAPIGIGRCHETSVLLSSVLVRRRAAGLKEIVSVVRLRFGDQTGQGRSVQPLPRGGSTGQPTRCEIADVEILGTLQYPAKAHEQVVGQNDGLRLAPLSLADKQGEGSLTAFTKPRQDRPEGGGNPGGGVNFLMVAHAFHPSDVRCQSALRFLPPDHSAFPA